MKMYIKTHIWDMVFIVMIGCGLILNIFSSFVIETTLLSNYPLIIISVICVAIVMFIAGYNKKTAIGGSGVLAIVAGIVFIYFRTAGILSGAAENATKSSALFWSIIVLTTIGTYLLTRTDKLSIAFSVGALVACAVFRFLEYPVSVAGFFVLLAGLILEVLYRVYAKSVMGASYGGFNFTKFTVQSIAIVSVVLVLSGAVFYGIIDNVSPPTRDLKLITKLLSWDVVEKIGISTKAEVRSDDLTSSKTNNNKIQSNSTDKQQEEKKKEKQKDEQLKKDNEKQLEAEAISYEYDTQSIVLIIIAAVLIVILPFALKFLLRKRRNDKVHSLEPEEGVLFLYGFFLKKLKILHIKREPNNTLAEFVEISEIELDSLTLLNGVSFSLLTDIYIKQVYGNQSPSPDEYQLFMEFYDSFLHSVRKKVGGFKYAFIFWAF